MVHSTLCKQQEIRFNEILPGRVLHVRIPGKSFSMDAISCYQYVWRSKENLQSNKDNRNLAPHFQNSWETRKEVPEGVIVDEEGSLPIHIDVPLQDSLQQIICSWARQEHTHALLPSPDVVCVPLPRFTDGEKDLRAVQLEPSVSVPFFHSSTPEVTWEEYSLEALIIHQGPSADTGHYRAAVRAGDEWYLGDDALAPSACALNDSQLTTGSYLLFLKQVRAAPPVIVVE
eukprot:s2689_g7.t1